MVTVPAFVWSGGLVRRAVVVGGLMGTGVGILAWLDSGVPLVGAIVFVVVGVIYGLWMSRRMTRYWPESRGLTGDERVSVVRAARRGESVGDDRLAQALAGYVRGLHAAAHTGRGSRWLLGVVLVVASATAVWDAVFGSWGSAVASFLYLAALGVEVWWWPRRREQLLADADRAAALT